MEWDKTMMLELDATGESEVRAKLARGEYASSRKEFVIDWLKKKVEIRNEALKQQELASGKFKDYRNSGVAFSVTLISLSSGLMVWTYKLLERTGISPNRQLLIAQSIACAATVISCVLIQFFNYQGYKADARALFGQGTKTSSTKWFDREDLAVYISIVLFALTIFNVVVYSYVAI